MSEILKKQLNNICLMMEMLARVYQGIGADFSFAGHKGFSAFLWWELMERWEIIGKLQKAMVLSGYKPSFQVLQAVPSEYQSPIVALKEMLSRESMVMQALESAIMVAGDEKSYIIKNCLVDIATRCQKEYNEVHGVLKKLELINPDIAALMILDDHLEGMYSKKNYHAKELANCKKQY